MLVEGLVAIGTGIAARSIALTAFGVDSGIEIVSAAVVLHRLRVLDPDGEARAGAAERRAARVVGLALYGVAAYIVVSSTATLVLGIRPGPSTSGILLLLTSVAV